jgi:hypothetical protein
MAEDQDPKGYHYEPLPNDGPLAKSLEQTWSKVGSTIGGVLGYDAGLAAGKGGGLAGAALGTYLGEKFAGAIGHEAGFYIDNATIIEQNLETIMRQLSDPAALEDPLSP